MTTILELFTSIQFQSISIIIVALTYGVRLLMEFILDQPQVPMTKYGKFWTKVALPILPIFVGAIFCIVFSGYTYPEAIKTFADKVGLGIIAGLFSGFEYQIVKGILEKQLPPEVAAKIEEESKKVANDLPNV